MVDCFINVFRGPDCAVPVWFSVFSLLNETGGIWVNQTTQLDSARKPKSTQIPDSKSSCVWFLFIAVTFT